MEWQFCRAFAAVRWKSQKIPLPSGRLVLYFPLCVSRNTLIKQEIFQALAKKCWKRLLYLFSLKLYLPLSLASLWIKHDTFSLLRETSTALKVNSKVHVCIFIFSLYIYLYIFFLLIFCILLKKKPTHFSNFWAHILIDFANANRRESRRQSTSKQSVAFRAGKLK